jgi:stress-induced morphogen
MAGMTLRRTAISQKLKDALVKDLATAGIPARVQTEAVIGTNLTRVTVIAKNFKNLRPSERQDLVWRIVGQHLDAEQQLLVSGIVTMTPGEVAGKW